MKHQIFKFLGSQSKTKKKGLQLLLSDEAVSPLHGKTQRNTLRATVLFYEVTMLNEFDTSTVGNAVSSSYSHVAVRSPYKFRETSHDHLSDSQVNSPETEIMAWIFMSNRMEIALNDFRLSGMYGIG